MNVQNVNNNTSLSVLGTINRWTLLKELGIGATSRVFLAVDRNTNERAAIKIFKKNQEINLGLVRAETCVMKSLNHPNILRLIQSYESVKFIDPTSGKISNVSAIVMEYASKGELFSVLDKMGRATEEYAKIYFFQLLDAIDHMHKKGIVHRDLKLENVLLDHKDTIKLADFGYSALNSCHKLFQSPVGTSAYFAPEIHENRPYSGEAADLFAAGIILFTMVTGHMPFNKAHPEDDVYELICNSDYGVFWDIHEGMMKKKSAHFKFDEYFKDLIIKMLSVNPLTRPTIKELKEHHWLQSQLKRQSCSKKIELLML